MIGVLDRSPAGEELVVPAVEPERRLTVAFPFLENAVRKVETERYKKVFGLGGPTTFNRENYTRTDKEPEDRIGIPGINFRGYYHDQAEGSDYWVVSFLYNKTDEKDRLEREERVIVLRGVGYGVHPGHKGQEPAEYLVGTQIGLIDPNTGLFTSMVEDGQKIEEKNWSVACFAGGPYGEPVLANPKI
jgi:hypothetical protein